jgi:tRNA pseudouridine32 synthase / 23S rRNA pseudouridine746 synthase
LLETKPENCVIYSDDTIIIANKPAGLLTIPDGYNRDLPYLRSVFENLFGNIWVVHRLDRDTSGIIILARTKQAHANLCEQFKLRKINKQYHALVEGCPDWIQIKVDLPLLVNGDRQHRTVVNHQRGKPAITNFQVNESYNRYSLIIAEPHTGYTHQIRSHLYAIGFPIIADTLYNPAYRKSANLSEVSSNLLIQRLALHAYSITFQHPLTEETCTYYAPYPEDFKQALMIWKNT